MSLPSARKTCPRSVFPAHFGVLFNSNTSDNVPHSPDRIAVEGDNRPVNFRIFPA